MKHGLRWAGVAAALSALALAPGARAQPPRASTESRVEAAAVREAAAPDARADEAGEGTLAPDAAVHDALAPAFRARARIDAGSPDARGRAATRVTRDEMDERVVRSAPDALRFVPGVSVQQTTHGQASPYVRGVTGQQLVFAFDGIRLNNGTYRQGPNQYFFTIDAATLAAIDVVRGSASTRWGSDAIGGAVLAAPREPTLDAGLDGVRVRPRALGRAGTADRDAGGRVELEAQLGRDVAVLVGGGYRDADRLQGGGVVRNPADGRPARAPLVEADGRTQHGTGFRYGAYDARLVARAAPGLRVVAALYGFQQYDTPRADRCPAPFASLTECLTFAEQFHHLAYVSLRGAPGPDLPELDATVSYQRQHEVRLNDRPASFVRTEARDDVDTVGASLRLGGRALDVGPALSLSMRGGAEAYVDHVASSSTLEFTDLGRVFAQSRGQYADGARHATGGAWGELRARVLDVATLRGGLRVAFASARAAAEPRSGTTAVAGDWAAPVANVGLEVPVDATTRLSLSLDQGFRAPNLDDLTSRQVIGPGYQFENPSLAPERATTLELGVRTETPLLEVQAWAYATQLESAITRAPRPIDACPPMTIACQASWTRFQLVNTAGDAWIVGGELAARVALPSGLRATATVHAAWGEGPNPAPPPNGPAAGYAARVPLSRIPPVGGTLEARYLHRETGLSCGAALRWAAPQDRLSPSDQGDARIPIGGTPAYAVLDLRAGYRLDGALRIDAVLENVFDEAYRVHGSGVNGAGRGVLLSVEGGY